MPSKYKTWFALDYILEIPIPFLINVLNQNMIEIKKFKKGIVRHVVKDAYLLFNTKKF